jgi:hypothetical protein
MLKVIKNFFGSKTWADLENATLDSCDAGQVFRYRKNGRITFSAFIVPPRDLLTQRTFEKTPNYFDGNAGSNWTRSPEHIHQLMPSCKMIIILRNPTDRAYSAYKMKIKPFGHSSYVRLSKRLEFSSDPVMQRRYSTIKAAYENTDQVPSFGEIIDLCLQQEMGNHVTDFPRGFYNLISRGCYSRFFPKWIELFGHNQLYINTLENWVAHPFDVIDEIQEFLELDHFDYRKIAHQNERGFWVIRGRSSKGNKSSYAKLNTDDREKLNAFYAPWNEQLKAMFPTVPIPW